MQTLLELEIMKSNEKYKKYREELEVLIQEFRDYKISSIPYQW